MENALELKNVSKHYKGFSLKDVSFAVPRGYIMGFIGPNGAGKTTTIKLIMNLITRDGGEITVFGRDNIRHEVESKSRIGFVYDDPTFTEDLRLQDLMKAYRLFYEKWDVGLFASLAGEFGLPMKKRFKNLSSGMKMKLSLALALSHRADLLIMDEPTTGLDPVFRRQLLGRLAALIENERTSILFSTHIASDLDRIADYIAMIRDGQIVFSTTKDELSEHWGIIKGDQTVLHKGFKHLIRGFRRSSYGVEALTSNVREARRILPSGATVEKAGLEDIMFFLAKGEKHG